MTNRFGGNWTRVPQVPKSPDISNDPLAIYRLPETPIIPKPAVDMPADPEDERKARWQNFNSTVRHASYPEFICYEWLQTNKKLEPDIDFVFQYPVLGGKTQFGGFVLDFYIGPRNMAWFIQGLEFHYVDARDRARDRLAKAIVSDRGILVVELFEDDILQRTTRTLESAWNGVQVSSRNQDI